jgi:hypothetical protein
VVVPRLACRACPRLNGVVDAEVGLPGVVPPGEGELAGELPTAVLIGVGLPGDATASSPAATPFMLTGADSFSSDGVVGCELMIALPSSVSAS